MITKTVLKQAIGVLLILAEQEDGVAVKSGVLSEFLGVSDSYLKKLLGQLVHAEILHSTASKTGGVSLAMDLQQLTLLDVFHAVEGEEPFFNDYGIHWTSEDNGVFNDKLNQASGMFKDAETKYKEALAKYTLKDLLRSNDPRQEVDEAEKQKKNKDMQVYLL